MGTHINEFNKCFAACKFILTPGKRRLQFRASFELPHLHGMEFVCRWRLLVKRWTFIFNGIGLGKKLSVYGLSRGVRTYSA